MVEYWLLPERVEAREKVLCWVTALYSLMVSSPPPCCLWLMSAAKILEVEQ